MKRENVNEVDEYTVLLELLLARIIATNPRTHQLINTIYEEKLESINESVNWNEVIFIEVFRGLNIDLEIIARKAFSIIQVDTGNKYHTYRIIRKGWTRVVNRIHGKVCFDFSSEIYLDIIDSINEVIFIDSLPTEIALLYDMFEHFNSKFKSNKIHSFMHKQLVEFRKSVSYDAILFC